MTSIFTKIMQGTEPGEIIYHDEHAYIILERAPFRPGHSLVIAKCEVPTVYDLSKDEYLALMDLGRRYSEVLKAVFQPRAVAQQIMGLGVAHAHLHIVPIKTEHDMDQSNAVFLDLAAIKPAADRIRAYLAEHPLESIQ